MESQPQKPEFRINPENFHPCNTGKVADMELCFNLFVLKGVRLWILSQYLNTVSHFSYAPLIKCKITRKRNVIFLF